MLDKHIDPLQNILREGEQVGALSPFARLNWHYSTTEGSKEKEATSTLVTAAIPQVAEQFRKSLASKRRNDITLQIFPDLPTFPQAVNILDDKSNQNLCASLDGKIHLMMFLNKMGDENKQILAQLASYAQMQIDIHLVPFGLDIEKVKKQIAKNSWSQFSLAKTGGSKVEKQLQNDLGIDRFPFSIMFYNKRIIMKGQLNIQDIQEELINLGRLNMFEAVSYLYLPALKGCELWDSASKREVSVGLQGDVILEFWDNNSLDIVWDKEALIQSNEHLQRARFVQVYAGSGKKELKTGYRLKNGLANPTAQKLQVFELPCTFILHNGNVL